MSEVKLTILCDNINGCQKGFTKDVGFSVLLSIKGKRILFDTGMIPETLISNIKTAGIKPDMIDAVILSHNHNDHTNGLASLLPLKPDIPVYIHSKWEIGSDYCRGMDIPKKNKIVVKKAGAQENLPSDILFTKPLPSKNYGGINEHAIYIKIDEGFIFLCGCCHSGLNGFLEQRKSLGIDEHTPIHIIGGMHGFKFTDDEADKAKSFVKSITCCHCTRKLDAFEKQFKENFSISSCGAEYIFQAAT